jgi:hypothetical protein
MNDESTLDAEVEAHLRAIWKGGAVSLPTWTPEQVQKRATQFEAHTRRLAFGDLLGFLLVPLIVLVAVFRLNVPALAHHSFGRIQLTGAALLILCSLVGYLVSRNHSYAIAISDAHDLLASHLERLARLRDWYLSTPWGAGMYLPGVALILIGVGMNPNGLGWEMPIIGTGIGSFVYLIGCVQTRLKARSLQREIDSLAAMRSTGSA